MEDTHKISAEEYRPHFGFRNKYDHFHKRDADDSKASQEAKSMFVPGRYAKSSSVAIDA